MRGLLGKVTKLVCLAVILTAMGATQNIPDAPTPKNVPPANPFPDAPPAPKNNHPPDEPAQVPSQPQPGATQQQDGVANRRDDLFKLSVNVTFIEVPVTVRDGSNRLVEGLQSQDFTVYEDGVPQRLSFFSSDPFPLSVAVVVDSNLPASTMKKVNETLPALVGAFSQFDEVALYRYGTTVQQVAGFAGAGEISTASLEHLKRTGKQGGAPVVGGPFGAQGPTINNRPVDPSIPPISTAPPQESNVLNDAILRAAQDLSRRQKGVRRRIIFVISDGREYGSTAHYDEVRKVLLAQGISVYALGVDTAAMPVYDQLNRVRLPGFGYGDILSKYASATGGDTAAEFDQRSIEQAYSRITEVARNQYTLGYNTKATLSGNYRSIDVHVHRPDLKVTAKAGYYPLPPPPPPH